MLGPSSCTEPALSAAGRLNAPGGVCAWVLYPGPLVCLSSNQQCIALLD